MNKNEGCKSVCVCVFVHTPGKDLMCVCVLCECGTDCVFRLFMIMGRIVIMIIITALIVSCMKYL